MSETIDTAKLEDGETVQIIPGSEQSSQQQTVNPVIVKTSHQGGVSHIPGFGGDRSDLLHREDK